MTGRDQATASERWQRIQALCESLEAVPIDQHEGHLTRMEPDTQVRTQVLALLQAVRDEAILQHTVKVRRAVPSAPPRTIGEYRIIEQIGVGGSGEVYRALRTINGIDQAVAVKCFHPHRSDGEHVDRFKREQRMLSALRHPDIVRLIDAGVTEDGRPFLAMELADGEPITAFCDVARLKISERIRLICEVCDAVQAAHRQLIVHLDLKPANILVTAERRIKLLDFGTAKLMDQSTAQITNTQSLTVLYASPEQLRSEPVSVACDVYSLGLILYELVSGGWPFRRPDTIMSVAERAAGHVDPAPLDARLTPEAAETRGVSVKRLRQIAGGDLDAICRKALAHDPASRYSSAEALANDLRRFLAGAPVQARRITIGYRARKFVRRHTIGIAAAATVVLALSAAGVYSIAQARAARLAASRAEAANSFLTSLFTMSGRDSAARSGMTVRELLTLAEARVAPTLGGDPVVAADIETALGTGFVTQNAFGEAEGLFTRALAHAAASGDVPRQAIARSGRGYVRYVQNRTAEAWADAIAALNQWSEHQGLFNPRQAVDVLLTGAATLSYVRTTDPVHRPYFEACLDISRRHPGQVTADARARCLLGLATSFTIVDSRYDAAMPLLEEAIRIQRANPNDVLSLATTLQMQGMVMRYRGQFAEDELAQRESYDITARLHGPHAMSSVWQRAAWVLSLIGVGRLDDAYRESQTMLADARRLVPTRGSYMLWTPLFTATAAACVTGRDAECETLARESLETLGPTPASTDARASAARGFLGAALARQGQCAAGVPMIDEAIAMNLTRRRADPYGGLLAKTRDGCK
jgi:tetratricopeptide (TPR) repeat protein